MSEVEKARRKFYEAIRKVNRGEIDEDQLIPGAHGKIKGSTEEAEEE